MSKPTKRLTRKPDKHAPTCYACDEKAVGSCDRTHFPEGDHVAACVRHADGDYRPWLDCRYCGGAAPMGVIMHEENGVVREVAHVACESDPGRAQWNPENDKSWQD